MNRILNQMILPAIGIRRQLINVYNFGLRNYIKTQSNKLKSFEYTLVIATIVKDEDDYLLEWVSYHKVIGVDHIVIYDNSEQSQASKILGKFIDVGFVEIVSYPGRARQLEAYMDSITKFKGRTEWLITLDIDEFLTPLQFNDIKYFLREIPFHTSQILVSWLIYGSNGQAHKTDSLVLERFKRHADETLRWDYKPIVRPERVVNIKIPHYFEVVGKTSDEYNKRFWIYPYVTNKLSPINHPRKIRINHYYTKSKEEFSIKKNRGFADETSFSSIVRNRDDFIKQDRNELIDDTMKKWLPSVKEIMEKFRVEYNE